jgi:polar amino acid transport system substrate-binding protein
VRRHAMDTALQGQVLRAGRVYADTPDAAFDLLRTGRADIMAGIRPGLLGYSARLPGSRVLDERYGANVLALAVRKGEAERLAFVSAFVAEAKRSGLMARIIADTGLGGVAIEPE